MSDLDLNPAAAIRAFAFSHAPAAPSPSTIPTSSPTAAPTAPAVPVEPHSHAGLSPREVEIMIGWERDALAQGRITEEEAAKRFDALGATPEQRAPDMRSDEVKQLDKDFPPARPQDFIIQYYTPGQQPAVLSKEMQVFDSNARKWMAAMGLSREQGNNMATFIAKAIQQTKTLSANERDAYKENENVRLDRVLGPGWDDQLKPANRMIAEVNALHPGFTDFVRTHGDNALFITQLVQAARIYDARKGR